LETEKGVSVRPWNKKDTEPQIGAHVSSQYKIGIPYTLITNIWCLSRCNGARNDPMLCDQPTEPHAE